MALAIAADSASAQPDPKVSQQEAVIDALLKQPAPPPDWREHLKKRKEIPLTRPHADAPGEELISYWRTAPETEVPDEATRARLLEACEAAPNEIDALLLRLSLESSEVQDRLKKLYDRLLAERRRENSSRVEMLRDALMTHSHYFRDELIRRVFFPGDIGHGAFVEATAALIRLDREGAKKLFVKEATSNDLVHRALSLSNLRAHFIAETDAQTASGWLSELKRIAADPKSGKETRGFALSSVMSMPTSENDQWFLDLFRDPSLEETELFSPRTTLLGDVVVTRPDYWIAKIAPLVASKDPAIHANAVLALIQFKHEKARADALRPLLPWLENPHWAPDPKELLGRLRLIQSLDKVDLPEAVPALLKIIETASAYELTGAVEALAHHNAHEAIPPMKRALKREKEEYHRWAITRALVKLGGLSRPEMVAALSMYAVKMSTEKGQEEIEKAADLVPKETLDPGVSMGKQLARSALDDDELATDVLAEADRLVANNPAAADMLRQLVAKWRTPNANKAIVNRLRAGEFTAEWIYQLIQNRGPLATTLMQVQDLEGAARGVQAALTADPSLVNTVLEKHERIAQLALLAVARLARVELPVARIAQLLSSGDKTLVQAAELYLEANDSPGARVELLKHLSGKATILGARLNFDPGHFTFGGFDKTEKKLRESVLRDDGPREILALLSEGYWGSDGQRVILVEKDRAVLRAEDGNGRMREREVPVSELKSLVEWLAHERIEDLPPFDAGAFDGIQWEFVRVNRDGGRRIFMNNPPYGTEAPRVEIEDAREGPDPAIYGELTRRLTALTEGPMSVVYHALANLPGFEVVHMREKGEVVALRKQKDQLSAGIRLPSQEATAWHRVTESGLSKDFVVEKLRDKWSTDDYDETKGVDVHEGPLAGKRLQAVWVDKGREDGLWALEKDGKDELIAKGTFGHPVIGPGGEWIVAARTPPGKMWDVPNGVVRIHLTDRRVYAVDLPPADTFDAIVWVAARKRVLLHQVRASQDGKAGPETPEFYLLDPATGAHEKVTGEMRPFFDAGKHDLQPTGNPDEFWAARHSSVVDPQLPTTTIGRFNSHDFRFSPLVTCPDMQFDSGAVFVDEPAGAIWIAVNGDLLRLSLPGNSPLDK